MDKGKIWWSLVAHCIINVLLLCIYVEADAVAILSNRVRQINSQARLMVDDDSWPPEQLKSFTPLLLIYYQGHRNSKQVEAMAKLMHTGEIMSVLNTKQSDICHYPNPDHHETLQEVLDATIVTKKMEEILTPLEKTHEPHLILIEGAPGIGKTVLLKEIAYQWSKARLLQTFKVLLLVCLRDPIFQQAESISDLLRCFCKGDANAIEIATACSKYLFENGGKDILFLFDGFDELPEKLRTNSLIANILKRCVLPYCSLIVSSRPHASKHLHKQASLRVEILGFGEKEQQDYIQQVLQDQPDKIKELTQYLEHHLTVVSLCYVPFNLSVLLYLYKQGIPLPKSSTELYNCFICHTICRHLTRHGYPSSISNLSSLPEPYNKIIQQLSKLSLEALKHNKLVFTLDEIRAACPDIMAVKGDINGCGLLQAVECFSLTGTTVTLNFLHYSIQEYLAAHYIASLPAEEELKIIEQNFWNDIYFNVFTVYIMLTQGQKPAFKYFLSGGNKGITISKKFLDNSLQCLFLYRCFHEAGDDNICKAIEQSETSYANKEIKFSCTTLTASNMECITVFLTSAFHKQWEKLSLYNCHIQDHGLNILHQGLCRCGDVTMNTLRLSRNVLTIQSSPLISEITVKCKVKVLSVTGNFNIGENQHLYSILTNPLTVLEELYMYNIKLSSKGASYLFKALKDNKRLRELYLTHNAISDDACDAIVEALNNNNSLIQLHMSKNPLTGKAVVNMLDGLKTNNALRLLWLPKCPEDTNKIVNSLQDTINRGRESRGCQVKLMIICS